MSRRSCAKGLALWVLVASSQGCAPSASYPVRLSGSEGWSGSAEPVSTAGEEEVSAVARPADARTFELDADEVDEPIDDGGEDSDTTSAHHAKVVEHPLASVSDAELEKMLREDPASVGPMSVGPTNGGMLINGVQMPQGDRWEVNDLSRAWGTQETIDGLIRCIDVVHEQFPDSPKMRIGHVSARRGGPLSPHVSHQAGRDVDVSYYYTQPTRWFTRAHAGNLDRARTWAFVRALIVETDVEMILIDAGLQRLLREYAEEIGEDRAWLDDVFRGVAGKRPALIRHARGHATHIHVRFYSPIARETARRAQPVLVKFGTLESPQVHVMHRARKGDTLGRLANMYGTTVEAIKRANGLTSTLIRATRTYRIPKKGAVRPVTDRPISIPPRRLPPDASRGESTP